MDFFIRIIDFILHIDKHLVEMIDSYGWATYFILFAIIFSETGLVFLPFLPGDSLLFAAGALSVSDGGFNVILLLILCITAAFLGNTINYIVGHFFGERILKTSFMQRIIKPEQLQKSHEFFEKYGTKSIVLARFIPIIRTIVPFLAGISEMTFKKYTIYNFVGAFLWVSLCILSGYFFGQIPLIKDNFSFVVLAIIGISLVPIAFEVYRARKEKKK